jgi:hypothetical protein
VVFPDPDGAQKIMAFPMREVHFKRNSTEKLSGMDE